MIVAYSRPWANDAELAKVAIVAFSALTPDATVWDAVWIVPGTADPVSLAVIDPMGEPFRD